MNAKQYSLALALCSLIALAPLACGPEDAPAPGAELEGVDAGEVPEPGGDDAGQPGAPDASDSTPDAGVLAPDAGPGELADCEPFAPSAAEDEWDAVETLRDRTLVDALYQRVKGHTSVGYEGAKTKMFGNGGFDVHNGKIECLYSGLLFRPDQLDKTGGFNVEHSWPQSEFGNESTSAKADMHHLFGTERNVNSRRSSLPFGNTDCAATACPWAQYGCEVGPRIGGTGTVFEVRQPKRGDVARAHFYFAVRYRARISADEEATLKRWHHCDPPDAAERLRNSAIERYQQNRNPFVDRPEFVDYVADF